MLPGVEAARRRRFHNSSNNPEISLTTTRRSSFCLYASNNNEFHFSGGTSSSVQRNQQQGVSDEIGLGAKAREAKKRLDERLHPHRRSDTNRIQINRYFSRSPGERPIINEAEVHERKKNGSKRLNWLDLKWKSAEQEECTICLEGLKDSLLSSDDTLNELPCAHKFHAKCLIPWLVDNSHCPCCRMEIPSSSLA